MYKTETLESISLTWDQADQVNSQAINGNTNWGITGSRQLDDGSYVGYVSVGAGDETVKTDIKVTSDDGKTWGSDQYKKQARKVEGL